jgi:hypothetical protein
MAAGGCASSDCPGLLVTEAHSGPRPPLQTCPEVRALSPQAGAPFEQQLLDVAVGQVVPQIPANRDHDHLGREAESRERGHRGLRWAATGRQHHRPSLPDLALGQRKRADALMVSRASRSLSWLARSSAATHSPRSATRPQWTPWSPITPLTRRSWRICGRPASRCSWPEAGHGGHGRLKPGSADAGDTCRPHTPIQVGVPRGHAPLVIRSNAAAESPLAHVNADLGGRRPRTAVDLA